MSVTLDKMQRKSPPKINDEHKRVFAHEPTIEAIEAALVDMLEANALSLNAPGGDNFFGESLRVIRIQNRARVLYDVLNRFRTLHKEAKKG